MQKLEVGGYLYGTPKPMRDEMVLNFDDSGATLLISWTDMSAEESKKLRKGKMHFGLFEEDGIMFFLIRIPGIMDKWSDAPFHIGLYNDERSIPNIPEGAGIGLTIIGVNARDGMIKALRLVGLSTDMSREMVRIMLEQKQVKTSQIEHRNKTSKIYKKYSCEAMANKAIVAYSVGGHV